MLNRWQAHKGAACGEVASIIMCLEVAQHCSTSSTPNDSEVSAPRRLRYRSTSGYAWFAISDGTSSRRSPSVLRYAPTSRQGGASLADNLKNRINLCEPITHPRLRLPCSFTQIDLIKQILLFASAGSAISARGFCASRRSPGVLLYAPTS